MFGVVFDLSTEAADEHHPRSSSQAYTDIKATLEPFGFRKIQGSTYASDHEDLGQLYLAVTALRELSWFGPSVRNIRLFRLDEGADFTAIMKSQHPTGL